MSDEEVGMKHLPDCPASVGGRTCRCTPAIHNIGASGQPCPVCGKGDWKGWCCEECDPNCDYPRGYFQKKGELDEASE